MAHDFRCPERRQTFLLPPDMRDWLPEDDIVHLILDAVALMDLVGLRGDAQARRCGAGAVRAFDAAVGADLRLQPRRALEPGDRAAVRARCRLPLHRRRARAGPHGDRPLPAAPCRAAGGGVRAGAGDVPRRRPDPARAGGAGRHQGEGQRRAGGEPQRGDDRRSRSRGWWPRRRAPTGARIACSARTAARRCPRLWRGARTAWRGCAPARRSWRRQAAAAAARQQAKIDARAAEEQATGKRRRGRKPKPAGHRRRSRPGRQPHRPRERHHEDPPGLGAGLQRPGGGDAASRSSSPPR